MRVAVLPYGYAEGTEHLLRSPMWWIVAAAGLVFFSAGTREFYRLVHQDVEHHRTSVGGSIYFRHPALETAAYAALWICWMLPNPYRYAALFSVVPVRQVQVAVNNYLDVVAHTSEERRLTGLELVAVIVGGAVMLWLIGGAAVNIANLFESTNVPGYNG
jgi:hypothetical protein